MLGVCVAFMSLGMGIEMGIGAASLQGFPVPQSLTHCFFHLVLCESERSKRRWVDDEIF